MRRISQPWKQRCIARLANHTDTAGRATRFAWLPARTLAAVTRTLTGASNQAASIHYDYNEQMEALLIRDELNRPVESYALDLQGRPVAVTNLEGQVMGLSYYVKDWVRAITRFDGTVLTNAYDGDGRLALVAGPDFTNSFTYYRNGLPKTAVNGQGTVSSTYDGANRLTAVTQPVPQGGVNYAYLPAGQVSSVESV
ncbi:MAG: hypothetical protein EPN23_11325, partial [Verrucomicrobia bacterium]